MSAEHDEIMGALKAVQDSADTAAINASEEKFPLEMRDLLDGLSNDMREALKRLDNIESHMGIVPSEDLAED